VSRAPSDFTRDSDTNHSVYPFFVDEFGMDWTEKSITMWVRSRVRISFRYGFGSKNFWKLGELPFGPALSLSLRLKLTRHLHSGSFGYSYPTGEIIANPWAGAENPHVAPFDQDFYLR
jgi:hypothetical protein